MSYSNSPASSLCQETDPRSGQRQLIDRMTRHSHNITLSPVRGEGSGDGWGIATSQITLDRKKGAQLPGRSPGRAEWAIILVRGTLPSEQPGHTGIAAKMNIDRRANP